MRKKCTPLFDIICHRRGSCYRQTKRQIQIEREIKKYVKIELPQVGYVPRWDALLRDEETRLPGSHPAWI